MGSQDPCSCHHVIFVCVGKGEDADVADLILYSVPNMSHTQHHVGKRLKQNASLGYADCVIQQLVATFLYPTWLIFTSIKVWSGACMLIVLLQFPYWGIFTVSISISICIITKKWIPLISIVLFTLGDTKHQREKFLMLNARLIADRPLKVVVIFPLYWFFVGKVTSITNISNFVFFHFGVWVSLNANNITVLVEGKRYEISFALKIKISAETMRCHTTKW